jgi:hypothetical protein
MSNVRSLRTLSAVLFALASGLLLLVVGYFIPDSDHEVAQVVAANDSQVIALRENLFASARRENEESALQGGDPSSITSLKDPREDFQSALQTSFNFYDALLTGRSITPAWTGGRDIQADIAAVDALASVVNVHCIEMMCGVDVVFQKEIPEDFNEKLMNRPSMQGGSLLRRFDEDPARLRIYLFKFEIEPSRGDPLNRPGEITGTT